ncbi:MAG: ABC transporter ATP-binding protein [Deltaproteobacteria bacterium]|nr:ABC transporter ATP-binding protein [Deltaproteobacteria bacterium]
MTRPPTLTVENVSFAYGPRQALSGVSFAASGGQLVGIVGPNGSGKSTLLKVAAGIIVASEGACLLGGRSVGTLVPKERARVVAYCPQEGVFSFPFSALDVVLMARSPLLGMWGVAGEVDRKAAREAMALMDAEHLADRPIDELSGGERRRVVLARTIAQGAGVIVLDEPTAGLDIGHSIRVLDTFKAMAQKGALVLASLHDISEATAYCDRALLLKGGRGVAFGMVEEVLSYKNVRDTFGVDVYAGINELTGKRFLVPFGSSPSAT